MKKPEPKELIAKLLKLGLKPISYSGRGMYGDRCVAVVLERGEYPNLPKNYSMDNMGYDVVYYWPRCPWPEGLEDYE